MERTRSKGGGGYTQDYVPNYGFRIKPVVSSKTFPTTGFPGAKFQLVMTGAQADYDYQLINNPGDGGVVDKNGMVKLISKPSGTVTIRAVLKRDASVMHEYSFTPISVWAKPQGDFKGDRASGWQRCGGINKFLSVNELTNAPTTTIEIDPAIFWGGIFTRAIDGSLFSEWGFINQRSYPDSQWRGGVYWTRDRESSSKQYHVYSDSGHIGTGNDSWNNYVACKG